MVGGGGYMVLSGQSTDDESQQICIHGTIGVIHCFARRSEGLFMWKEPHERV